MRISDLRWKFIISYFFKNPFVVHEMKQKKIGLVRVEPSLFLVRHVPNLGSKQLSWMKDVWMRVGLFEIEIAIE
jgi:hypothetical protein